MASEEEERGTLVSPRITATFLKSRVTDIQYHHFTATLATTCSIKLVNGYSITETVVCTNPELYDETMGQKHALLKALDKLRELEYYLLKQRLYEKRQSTKGDKDGCRNQEP